MKFKHNITTIICFSFIICGQSMYAQVLDSCDQLAEYCSGNYCVSNNVWGEGAGLQCITAQSTTQFTVRSTQSGTGIKTYPNSSREMGWENVRIETLVSCTSTMNVGVPGSGDYCTAWNILCPEKVMIWMNRYCATSPWGSYVETATIGGVVWDVYKNGYPGFLIQGNRNNMTVDIKAILDYCVSKGWLNVSGVIEKIQGGFEITSTGGMEHTFTMNGYSVSYTFTGLTGTPTPVPTASPTPTPEQPLALIRSEFYITTTESTATFPPPESGVFRLLLKEAWVIEKNAVTAGIDYDLDQNPDVTLIIDPNQFRNIPPYAPTTPPTGNRGDVNDNGTIDIVDALMIAQYFVGLNPSGFNPANADVNCDGSIDIIDALLVAQYYVGLITNFPC